MDDRIKTGLKDTLEQFECRLSAAIGELREVVSLSIADSLKAQSIGGSGEGPSCPRVINPVEESAPNITSSRIDLTANQDISLEFDSTMQRTVLETPPPEREGTQAEYHMVTGAQKPPQRQQSLDTTLPIDITTQSNNPIDQLAQAIEKIAANKTPNHQTLLKPVSASAFYFDGKNEKFELFEDLFHTMLKMQPDMTEAMKVNHFHSHLRKEALQTFKNIQSTSRTTLEDVLVIFRRKYVKPQSVATAKHRWHRLTFDPSQQSLPEFLEELHESAERAFGDQAQQMIESLLYAKLPPELKKSINNAYLENGTYEQIIKHIEREMELNGLVSDEPLVKTMTATTTNQNKDQKSKPKNQTNVPNDKTVKKGHCYYCKQEGHMRPDCPKLKRQRELDNDPNDNRPVCTHCKKKGHVYEDCWDGPNAANQPKTRRLQIEKREKEQKIEKSKEDKASSSKDLN